MPPAREVRCLGEHDSRTPSDAFTELVLDHVLGDPVLLDPALMLIGLGRPDEHTGDNLHEWLVDNDPQRHDPTLYSELAILALGLVNWPHVATTIRQELESVTEATMRPVAHQMLLLEDIETSTSNATTEVSNPSS